MAECIFCGARANSKEHFWGKWLQSIHEIPPNDQRRPVHQHDVRDANGNLQIVPGWGQVAGSYANVTITKTVCANCNNGWMKNIQDRMIPVYRRLHRNENDLSPSDGIAIENWLGLKVLLHQERAARDGDALRLEQASVRDNVAEERRLNRIRFMEHLQLPGDWRFFVARQPHEPDQQVPGVLDYNGFAIGGNGTLGDSGFAVGNVVVRDVFTAAFYIFDFQALVTNLHLMLPGCYPRLIDNGYGRIVQLNGMSTLFPRQSLHSRSFQQLVLQFERDMGLNPREAIGVF